MIPSWLIEHQQLLSRQIQQQQLPHAILISGVSGAGKQALATWLTQTLLCQQLQLDEQQILQPCQQCKQCQLYLAGNFPDHKYITSEKNNIGVDEIRLANQFLQKKAQLSGNKTIVIPNAQAMTESAANALLKTLEEPSDYSHLILLSSDPDRLLATIISRCRLIVIRPPVGEQLNQQISGVQADAYQNLSHYPELSSLEVNKEYQSFVNDFTQFVVNNEARQALFEHLLNNEHGLRWFEKGLTDLMRQINSWPAKSDELLQQAFAQGWLNQTNIYACYKIFLQSHQQLVNLVQVNKNFVIEKMLIDMQNILRRTKIASKQLEVMDE